MKIINSQSLLNYNTFKINITADLFVKIKSQSDIIKILENKNLKKTPKFILGGGSNTLFTKNISGLVIYNQIKGITIIKENKTTIDVAVGSGENWDDFVAWSTQRNLYGIENLSLIPGSVGAAPIQNIGAYGCEVKDVFTKLEAIDIQTGKKRVFKKNECLFKYRDSIFKNELKNKLIITNVFFQLKKTKSINLSYQVLKHKIQKLKLPNICSSDVRKMVIKIRNSKLPNPEEIGNAGSFFKNPIINQTKLNKLQINYPDIPYFKGDKIKVPAAWLIDKLNWKGYRNVTCGVYEKHALVLINHHNASGKDIVNLSKKIKESVCKKFNIKLEEEVYII